MSCSLLDYTLYTEGYVFDDEGCDPLVSEVVAVGGGTVTVAGAFDMLCCVSVIVATVIWNPILSKTRVDTLLIRGLITRNPHTHNHHAFNLQPFTQTASARER